MDAREFASYDEVPYDALACTPSHPSKLAALAAVMGRRPPPVARARILELGCGVGANALPIAADLPGAEVVAIDLSERQIAIARAAAAELGVGNVDFRQLDILAVGPDLGRFDFVIAHGIYSWVPAEVRDRVFAICDQLLTDDGLGYLSYNTLPGAALTRILRDYLLFHTRGAIGVAAQSERADQGLAFLREALASSGFPPARFLGEFTARYAAALESIGGNRTAALHHDALAPINEVFYVRDVAAHAARHHLAYLIDARRWQCAPPDLTPEVAERLAELAADEVERQQYLDFVTMRTLRQSVFARAGAPIARVPQADAVPGLHVRSTLRPASDHPELAGRKAEKFIADGGSIKANHELTKAALVHLAAVFPQAVAFDALVEAAAARVGRAAGAASADDRAELARTLLAAGASEHAMVFFEAAPPPVASAAGPTPRGRALARWQLRTTRIVTNHLHESVTLEPLQAAVLERLDGTRDRAALLEALIEAHPRLVRNGKPVPAHQLRSVLTRDLDTTLDRLAQLALLDA